MPNELRTAIEDSQSPYFVALDLGSNSFHLLIAKEVNGALAVVDRVKEMVQIARGLENGVLTAEAQDRALECLRCFRERIESIPPHQIRIVGTKALRMAKNSAAFLEQAEAALGQPIQIISGYEEARLVYLGVAHAISHDERRRMVVDIGGGSTEFIIGQNYRPELLESLSIGCVTYAERFFKKSRQGGIITEEMMHNAYMEASKELELIRKSYKRKGWDITYGASGTMKVITELMPQKTPEGIISHDGLTSLYEEIIEEGSLNIDGVPKLRRDVLPSGIAILKAIFDQFKLQELHVSNSTLKEGLIYDTIGRLRRFDVRDETVMSQLQKYRVDKKQARRVQETAWHLASFLPIQDLGSANTRKLLGWAALLHEVGLTLSHSGHHHHARYLLQHGDLAGFNRYEQFLLATLVGCHRRKLTSATLDKLTSEHRDSVTHAIVCLRLAAILNRSRKRANIHPKLESHGHEYRLIFPPNWLENNPLTLRCLQQENDYLQKVGLSLQLT